MRWLPASTKVPTVIRSGCYSSKNCALLKERLLGQVKFSVATTSCFRSSSSQRPFSCPLREPAFLRSLPSQSWAPNYSFKRTAATGRATIMRYATSGRFNSSVRPHKRFLFNARSLRHVGLCVLWRQLLRCRRVGYLRCSHAQRVVALLKFARESALHHALHSRPVVALRARLVRRAAILSLGSAVPSAGHNRVGCLPVWVRAFPSLRPNYSFERTAVTGAAAIMRCAAAAA